MENQTETKIAKIEATDLDNVVKNSGLAIQEADEIKASYLPFLKQLAETQMDASKINYENPSTLDESIARELRIRTVKIRTSAEKLKDERKRMYLLRGNLEQSAYKLIADSCKIIEETFNNVEKAHEIAEKKRKEALRTIRTEYLQKYMEDVSLYPLGEMSEDQFNALYNSVKKTYDDRIEAERRAEEERVAKEKANEAERVRIKAENEKLKKEAEEKEKLAEAERKNQADILAKQKEGSDKKERELKAKMEEEKRKADVEKKALEEKARKYAEEKEKLLAEIQTKKDAEEKTKKDEDKRHKEADRKAMIAPDRDKLLAFGQMLNNLPRPQIKSIEAAPIMANINGLLAKVNNYILEQANKL